MYENTLAHFRPHHLRSKLGIQSFLYRCRFVYIPDASIFTDFVYSMWRRDLAKGRELMRAGRDYVNNNRRYDRAFKYLVRAFENAGDEATALERARMCLWIGITLNENVDIEPPVKRNDEAIKWYKRGVAFLRHEEMKGGAVLLLGSLYNSLGVAYHHRFTRWNGGPIPKMSFVYYNKARALPAVRGMRRLVRQIDYNTGGKSGGGAVCNVAC